jgi:DNA polymerase elongation subunit (family B)
VRAKTDVNNLIKQANFLEAAQYLKMQARGSAKESDFLSTIAEATDGNSQGGGNFMPSKFHDTLLRLNPDIIVTTNYDKILERASASGYKVHDYASTAIGRLVRSGQPLIIKIHGSIDDPDGIILTRADYARLRKQGSDALEVLQALFLTRTALFIGYSLNDPDIQLVLENVLGARDEPISHYMLASKDVKEYQRDVLRYCYGTDIVSYRPGDYEEMFKMLVLLADLVDAKVASRALP